jgi:hypothetical protein
LKKERKVIELHKEGKTLKEISIAVHMSFRDISKIIKAYDKKVSFELKENTNPSSQKIKKPSISSQAFKLFSDDKSPVQVAIDLDIDFEKVRRYWTEFLRLKNMKKLYNIFIENEFHLDSLFRIYYFMRRNNISIGDIENVLRIAYDITKLYQTHSNLKTEIEKLEQIKKKYRFQLLPPMRPLPRYPSSWNSYYY